MLVATGAWTHGALSVETAIMLDDTCRAHVTRRCGLLFDSTFCAPLPQRRGVASVVIVAEGELAPNGGPAVSGPSLHVLAEDEFERVSAGAAHFRTWGSPITIMDLSCDAAWVRLPIGLRHGHRRAPPEVVSAMLELRHNRSDAELRETFARIAACLIDLGVLSGDIKLSESEPNVQKLWGALARIYAKHDTGAYTELLVSLLGMSPRQVERALRTLTQRAGLHGFRAISRVMRLRRAVLLLSANTLSIAEVASIVGYGSGDAMGRAFRDAGLPSPSTVRERVQPEP